MFNYGDDVVVVGGDYAVTTPGSRGRVIGYLGNRVGETALVRFYYLPGGPTPRGDLFPILIQHLHHSEPTTNPFTKIVGGI